MSKNFDFVENQNNYNLERRERSIISLSLSMFFFQKTE